MSSCRCASVDTKRRRFFRTGHFLLRAGIVALLIVSVTGCASVRVTENKPSKKLKPTAVPVEIFIEPFDPKSGVFDVNRTGAELEKFREDTAVLLHNKLGERLKSIAPVWNWDKNIEPRPTHGWLIRGKFVRVNEGSRALRTTLGFGLGATKMETKVRVYDLSLSNKEPVLVFETTGGSNAEPGVIGSLGPPTLLTGVGMVAGGFGNAMHGITEDSWRTAREIREHIFSYIKDIDPNFTLKEMKEVKEKP